MKLSPTMIAALQCIRIYMAAKDNVRKYRQTSCGGHEKRTIDALIRKNFVRRIDIGLGRIPDIVLTERGIEALENIAISPNDCNVD